MTLTLLQMQNLLRQVGFPEKEIPLMAAVGMGESRGKADAVNPGIGKNGKKTKEYSVGLWQINTLVHKTYTVEQLKNPLTNAKEALRIFNTQGLRAWGAYTDGGYRKFIDESIRVYQENPASTGKIIELPATQQPPPQENKTGFSITVPMAATIILGLYILTDR